MSQSDIAYWDDRYRAGSGPHGRRAGRRLAQYAGYVDALAASLAEQNRKPCSLDVACGAGGTLTWLARRGWHAIGVDASTEALQLAADAVSAEGLSHRCELVHADLDHWRPAADTVDLVTCFFFLDRALLPALRDAIRPGGLLILETFNRHRLAHRPQAKPDYLLAHGELKQLIGEWQWPLLAFHSDGPDVERPTDAIVAQRPLAANRTFLSCPTTESLSPNPSPEENPNEIRSRPHHG